MNQQKGMAVRNNEDWMSVWIGLFICFVALTGALAGRDLLGWGVSMSPWIWAGVAKSIAPVSRGYAWMPGLLSAFCTYLFLLVVMRLAAGVLKYDIRKFVVGFTTIFWASVACLFVGNLAYIAATSNQRHGFGIGWSLGLTSESGYIIALLAGFGLNLLVNRIAWLSGTASRLKEAARAEWYIKIALVILGAYLGTQIAGAIGLAKTIMLRAFVSVAVVYLIYWTLSYFTARKIFRFDRETSAVFASGISICGVAAANATGAAVKARKEMIAMVSALVVIFSAVEIMVAPFVVGRFLYREPLVAGSVMAMAVKTDGAAIASGTITQAVVQQKMFAATGMHYADGWMLMTTTTGKMLIDVFIGVFAFLLAVVWIYRVNKTPGEKIGAGKVWELFPKFILGYALTFLVTLFLSLHSPELLRAVKLGALEANGFRTIFFAMTFFSIGLAVDVKKFREAGFLKMAAAYAACLLVIIAPFALMVSWMAFHGILPPITK